MTTAETTASSGGASPAAPSGRGEQQPAAQPGGRRPSRLRGRPELYTSYKQDMAMFNTPGKRWGVLAIIAFAVLVPFLFADDLIVVLALGLAASIGAIGLNLVTGYAGQVSLGHAFFLGLGAITAAVVSGDPDGRFLGYGITFFPAWLLAAGLVAALAGLIVAPLAVRLRGLYLAIVTLGLVFLGEHIFESVRSMTGGPGVGRPGPRLIFFGERFDVDGEILGFMVSREQRLYLLMLLMLIIFGVIGRNVARSAVGRAFAAVRDRDIAAEVIGVELTKQKLLAFTISSFYAGVAGALLWTIIGFVEPTSFNLLLSVKYVAMVLIGGVATISGSIMGAVFIEALGRMTRQLAGNLPGISANPAGDGILNVFQLEAVLYGALIIGFLIFEPRGLFGIWFRVRNYWKGWPFSY
jgi:branched-chain amino acid transport system permease protein